jgi:hypothetical protein
MQSAILAGKAERAGSRTEEVFLIAIVEIKR